MVWNICAICENSLIVHTKHPFTSCQHIAKKHLWGEKTVSLLNKQNNK